MTVSAVPRVRRALGAASCVREPVRFATRELRGRAREERYRLRGSGLTACIRQPLLDMWVLEEIFRFGAYEPPPEAADAVAGLGRPPRVLDLGGHVGLAALFLLARFEGAEVTSFEPDPRNAPVLRRCIEANGLGARWQLVEACAATEDGSLEFESDFHLSGVAGRDERAQKHEAIGAAFPFMRGTALLDVERHQVQARDVLPFAAEADLLKIDIEGGEWEILGDPRFAASGATAVVLEYHSAHTPALDARLEARHLLSAAGFAVAEGRDDGTEGVLWGWRHVT